MKSKSFRLSIENPCPQNFDNFTPSQKGGFCQSCQKEVLDFTKMSEAELKAYFQQASAKTCGRFHPNQLKDYPETSGLTQAPHRWRSLGSALFGFSLLSIFPLRPALSQDLPPDSSYTQEAAHEKPLSPFTLAPTKTSAQKIEGIILADNDERLPGVSVYVKGTTTGTVSDMEGRFSLEYNFKEEDILVCSGIGLVSKEYKVSELLASESLSIQLTVNICTAVTLGEVNVEQIYRSRPSLWQRIKNIFR